MPLSIKKLGVDRLPLEERLVLLEELWDSIADDAAAVPLTPSQVAELDRRIADHEASPDDVLPWDQIRDTMLERLKR
jgi:putative addiction module component (TIGR02574 family)